MLELCRGIRLLFTTTQSLLHNIYGRHRFVNTLHHLVIIEFNASLCIKVTFTIIFYV